jgi:hypothetical protein
MVAVDYLVGFVDLYAAASKYGFSLTSRFITSESLITRARNMLVAQFLADPSFTHLMWIDSDVGYTGDDFVRLLQSNYRVVAGVYPIKSDGWPEQGISEPLPAGTTQADFRAKYASYPMNLEANHSGDDGNGFVEVLDAPTGFMLIERGVFLELIQRHPELAYKSSGDTHYAFFDTMIDPVTRTYLSEDFAFCRLIRGIGIRPFVDMRSKLMHQGVARYAGDLERSLSMRV